MMRTLFCLTFLFTSPAFSAPPAVAEKEADPEIQKLIEKAEAARDQAVKAVPRARGAGTYKVRLQNSKGTVQHKERSNFWMAFDGSKEFIQFHYQPGAGFEEADVSARVVSTDGIEIYDARFCPRISMGAEVYITENIGEGLHPTVWMSGKVIDYYSKLRQFLESENKKLSIREEKGLKIVRGTYPDRHAAMEFWIDPQKSHHIVRFRVLNYSGKEPFIALDVIREWGKADHVWYVKRCISHSRIHKDGEVLWFEEAELTFDSFEPLKEIPREVFSIHALGLPKWAWIRAKDPKDPDEENIRYEPDPKFDRAKVEKIVGKLPKVAPAK